MEAGRLTAAQRAARVARAAAWDAARSRDAWQSVPEPRHGEGGPVLDLPGDAEGLREHIAREHGKEFRSAPGWAFLDEIHRLQHHAGPGHRHPRPGNPNA